MANKKFRKIFIYGFLLGFGLIFAGINSVNAQQVLPEAGDSLGTAVAIQPGAYQAGELPDKTEVFYSVQGKAGQEIKVKGVFVPYSRDTLVSITLYDENKEEMAGSGWDNGYTPSASWLLNSEHDNYKYYIKVSNDSIWGIKSYSLEMTLTDRYDANSQTDAGDTFDKALSVGAGDYQGYLAGECGWGNNIGNDLNDYYKITLPKGKSLDVKVTPPSDKTLQLKLYDKDRSLLLDKVAENPGQILKGNVQAVKNADIFVGVLCPSGYKCCSGDKEIVSYGLNLAIVSPEEVEKEEEEIIVGEGQAPGSTLGPTEGPTPGQAPEAKAGWKMDWRMAVIILIVILLIIFFLLIRPKKKPIEKPAEAPPTEEPSEK